MPDQTTCKGCGNPIVGRRRNAEFCSNECKNRTKSAEFLARIRADPQPCSYPGCERIRRTATVAGLCAMHYRRKRLGMDMNAPARAIRGGIDECSVEGCERKFLAKGLCGMHYNRLNLTGEIGPVDRKRRHGLHRWTDKVSGYVYLEPGFTGRTKRMLEHRWVMEQELGRELFPSESVHHLNGNRTDNRIENLELWTSSHPSGQRVADKLAWAHELIELYEGKYDLTTGHLREGV